MKFKFCILILIYLFSSFKAFAIPRCEELLDVVYNDTIRDDVNIPTRKDQKTIGIRLAKYWSAKEDGFKLSTDENGYFIVGKITKYYLSKQIDLGDAILSINDIDLRELAKDKKKLKIIEKDISDLFEKNELIKFKILKKNKITNKKKS